MMGQMPAGPAAVQNRGVNLDRALLRSPQDSDNALDAWPKVLKVITADARTNVTVTFATKPIIDSPAELRTMVNAMGLASKSR